MTTQQAYDRIRDHFSQPDVKLARKPGRAAKGKPTCFYRLGQEPKAAVRCAIGCLIPDSRYRKKFDGGTMDSEDVVGSIPSLADADLYFLLDAQTAHDAARSPQGFVRRLAQIAEAHGLTP